MDASKKEGSTVIKDYWDHTMEGRGGTRKGLFLLNGGNNSWMFACKNLNLSCINPALSSPLKLTHVPYLPNAKHVSFTNSD